MAWYEQNWKDRKAPGFYGGPAGAPPAPGFEGGPTTGGGSGAPGFYGGPATTPGGGAGFYGGPAVSPGISPSFGGGPSINPTSGPREVGNGMSVGSSYGDPSPYALPGGGGNGGTDPAFQGGPTKMPPSLTALNTSVRK